MSGAYQHYRGYCTICGKELPKRSMNKIFIGFSNHSCVTPKLVCSICDNCLPTLFDTLGVPEPNRETKGVIKGKLRHYCKNCYNTVGKTALFCPYCGKKLSGGSV